MGTKDLPPVVEETLEEEIKKFISSCLPNAFYQTWTSDGIDDLIRKQLEDSNSDKAISVSGLVATIGPRPEEELSQLLLNGETNQAHLLTAIAEESANLAFQFLFKLLVEDAKQDDCEIGEPLFVKEEPLLTLVLTKLSADQEGITLDSAKHLSPRFTRIALAPWIPITKRKKHRPLSRKGK